MRGLRGWARVPLAVGGCCGAVLACDDASSASADGRIEVTVLADEAAPENVGYTLTLNGADPRLLDRAGTVVYGEVPEGTHTVLLFGLPEGCEVRGPNPQVVQVFGEGSVAVEFSVRCAQAASGGFRIEVTSVGEPVDDDGYQLAVAGAPVRVIPVDAFETYVGLAAGLHLITLKDVIPECRLRGGNPQPFTVVAGKSVLIRLQVICGAPPGNE